MPVAEDLDEFDDRLARRVLVARENVLGGLAPEARRRASSPSLYSRSSSLSTRGL